jgi:hypothetical protein
MTERKYLPTLAELVDRLSIVILKSVFLSGDLRRNYLEERAEIEHDIDMLLAPKPEIGRGRTPVGAPEITAILVIMLANRFIWENEAKARQGGNEQDQLLKLTHSINGVRAQAKNEIARWHGDRIDLKVDCLAANLPKEFGNWNLFEKIT